MGSRSFISRVFIIFRSSRVQKHVVPEMAPFYKTLFLIVVFIKESFSANDASDDSTSSRQNATSSVSRDKRFLPLPPFPSMPSMFFGKTWNGNWNHQCECYWSTHQGKRCRVKTGQGEWSEWGSSSKCSPQSSAPTPTSSTPSPWFPRLTTTTATPTSPTPSPWFPRLTTTTPSPCRPDQLPCQAGNPMTQCFPMDKFCDGTRQCANGKDEPLRCRIRNKQRPKS